jgi:hypothetical protein
VLARHLADDLDILALWVAAHPRQNLLGILAADSADGLPLVGHV